MPFRRSLVTKTETRIYIEYKRDKKAFKVDLYSIFLVIMKLGSNLKLSF